VFFYHGSSFNASRLSIKRFCVGFRAWRNLKLPITGSDDKCSIDLFIAIGGFDDRSRSSKILVKAVQFFKRQMLNHHNKVALKAHASSFNEYFRTVLANTIGHRGLKSAWQFLMRSFSWTFA